MEGLRSKYGLSSPFRQNSNKKTVKERDANKTKEYGLDLWGVAEIIKDNRGEKERDYQSKLTDSLSLSLSPPQTERERESETSIDR